MGERKMHPLFGDVSDLPPQLLSQLKWPKDKQQDVIGQAVIRVLNSKTKDIDTIMVDLFRAEDIVISDRAKIRNVLIRLTQDGLIERVAPGVYRKPKEPDQ